MTKINFLRKQFCEKYEARDLASAVEIGEALLREHWHNRNTMSKGYANDLFNLGCAYEELGYLERAAAMYSDSASRLSLVEGENLTFAERINNLAAVLIRLGLVEPAFFMLGNVAAIRRRELGVHSPKYADSLYNLANAAADVGRRKDSLSYHTEALRIRQNEGHTKDIIHSLHSIAFLHESAAEYEKAVPYAETAVKHSIGDDRAYAESCNYLAGLYENCNKFEAALPLYEQVLEITNETVGSEHSAYLNIALRRAHLLSLMNRPHEALVAHEDVCSAFTRVSGTRHIFYANCLRGMAMIHKNLKNPDRAEELILEAMKIRRVMYEDITLDITFLIHLHLQENNPVKALEALIYALMCSGNNSPEFSELLDTLVDLFSKNKTSATVEFINSMEMLNDKEKLRPIIDKWENWEKGNV